MGMDPKQMRVLEDGQASEEDLPRDTSRDAVREQARTGRMKARRDHSKGDGNFPSTEASGALDDERPEDSTATDLPKGDDDRSAPKGETTTGQGDRNSDMAMRDDAKPRRGRAESGMPRARRAATPKGPAKSARPTARRSSAAKRDAVKRVVKRSAPKKAKTRGGSATRAKARSGAAARSKTRSGATSRGSRSRR